MEGTSRAPASRRIQRKTFMREFETRNRGRLSSTSSRNILNRRKVSPEQSGSQGKYYPSWIVTLRRFSFPYIPIVTCDVTPSLYSPPCFPLFSPFWYRLLIRSMDRHAVTTTHTKPSHVVVGI